MRALLRLARVKEYLKSSLWVLPAAFVAGALILGTVLSQLRPSVGSTLEPLVFGGTATGARALLTALAGAMITVIGLTFSLTVIALQMAAGQYSPRVMRGFLSDRGVQLVLSWLVGTFAYCVAVLRIIRESTDGSDEVLPELAVTVGVLFALGALGMLVYFLHHITRQLRVETILREIAQDTLSTVDTVFTEELGCADGAPRPPEPSRHAHRVRAKRSGYLQAVERHGLIETAKERDVVVRLRPAVGYHVTEGTTLAWVWRRDGTPFDPDEDGLDRLVHDRVQLGPERTMQQDVSFGVRLLVDVGVKALSTGMNDPTTAVEALGQLSTVLCRLATRQLGNAIDADDDGEVRVMLPRPGFRDYLHLLSDQLQRYGGAEPAVVLALLAVLGDVAEQVGIHDERVAGVAEQVDRTLEVAARELDETELVRVQAVADQVRATLAHGRRPQPEVRAE
jgi:uncharacterized membrane protein